MSRRRTVSGSVVIDVDPQVAYAAVSDVTQMGRWSPENLGGTIRDGSDPGQVAVGTPFVGANRRGRAEWVTGCVVTAADPGRRFAFRVHRIGLRTPTVRAGIATWDYRFEPAEDAARRDGGTATGGTLVTETWTDDRPWPDFVATAFDKVVTGGRTFEQFQRTNIRRTLDRLKSELEAGRTS